MRTNKKKLSNFKKVFIGIITLITLLGIAMGIYISDYYRSSHSLEEYIKQSSTTITEENALITIEGNNDTETGIIFYPGGKVEYTAYIKLLEPLAKAGYTCYIPKMPANLAVFGKNKAEDIMSANKDIHIWYLAGHSLGGAMASAYAAEHSDELKGIIFLGSYPAYDLSKTNLDMLSIKGSEDGVLDKEKYNEAKSYAPQSVIYEILEGGNHAHFGDYGDQTGDGVAATTAETQQKQTIQSIEKFITQ